MSFRNPTLVVDKPWPPNRNRFPEVSDHVTLPQREPGVAPPKWSVVWIGRKFAVDVVTPELVVCVRVKPAGIQQLSDQSHKSLRRPGKSGGFEPFKSRPWPPKSHLLPALSVQVAAYSRPPGSFVHAARGAGGMAKSP